MINITNVISTTYHYYGLYIHQYVYIGYTYMFRYVFICLDDDPTNPCLTGWWSRLQFCWGRECLGLHPEAREDHVSAFRQVTPKGIPGRFRWISGWFVEWTSIDFCDCLKLYFSIHRHRWSPNGLGVRFWLIQMVRCTVELLRSLPSKQIWLSLWMQSASSTWSCTRWKFPSQA